MVLEQPEFKSLDLKKMFTSKTINAKIDVN